MRTPLISPTLRQRPPLITEGGARTLLRLTEHPDAPRWSYTCGDRIVEASRRDLLGEQQ